MIEDRTLRTSEFIKGVGAGAVLSLGEKENGGMFRQGYLHRLSEWELYTSQANAERRTIIQNEVIQR